MRYLDNTSISFTSSQVEYRIGTDLGTEFKSESLLFRCDQDCYVRFGGDASLQVKIVADTWFEFDKKATRIFVTRITTDGTLDVWAEGNIAV